jgi:hypothetical protein
MSACDFLNQFFHSVIGPAMVPKGIGVPGAVGNQLTCDIQGFLAYATGAASGLYNVSLAICYLLIVRYRYTDEQLRKLEPYFFYPPVSMFLLMAIAGLPFQIYNFNGQKTCFIGASPIDCDNVDSPIECERGTIYMYWNYANAFVIFLAACAIIFCMIRIYSAVLKQDRSGDRFRFRMSSSARASANVNNGPRRSALDRSRELSNTMKSQGLWYSGAFLFTFFPLMLRFIWHIDAIHVLVSFTFHLIGFTNAVIYIRPRFLKFRRDYPAVGIGSSISHTITRTRPAATGGTNSTSATPSSSSLRVSLEAFLSRMKSIVSRRSSIDTPSGVQNETDLVPAEQEEGIARPTKSKGEQSSLTIEHTECHQEQLIVVDEGGFEEECRYSVDQEEDGDLEDFLATKTDITCIQKQEDEKDTSSATNSEGKFHFEKNSGEMEVGSGNGSEQES